MSDFVAKTLNNGRYQILRVLGSGGMSIVYEALDTRLNVRRAIKVLHRRFAADVQVRRRFETEAMAQASLRHPNILMVHDVIDDDDGVYLVMELADQGSLTQKIRAAGPMPPREVVQVGIALAGALQVAHEAGLVHRDIKPENVLIDNHGTVKIADFGIARIVNRTMGMTRTGAILGTWAYMPPEQREGSATLDHRADIYALGVSMYYLLTMQQRSDLHNAEAYEAAFEGWPPGLAEVIKTACRFRPEDRYADCNALVAALSAIEDTTTGQPLVEVTAEELAAQQGGGAATAIPSALTGFHDTGMTMPDVDMFDPNQTELSLEAKLRSIPPELTDSPTAYPPPLDDHREHTDEPALGGGLKLALVASILGGVLLALVAGGLALAWLAPELLASGEEPGGEEIGGDDGEEALAEGLPSLEGTTEELRAVEGEPGLGEGEAQPEEALASGSPAEAGTEDPVSGEATEAPVRTTSVASTTPSEPVPVSSGTRVIEIKPLAGTNTADITGDDEGGLPDSATGRVRVRTVPSGATVRVDGKALSKVGGSYTLPVGSHVLQLSAADGETTRIPVQIRRDQTVDICYSFDTNSACGS